MESPEDIKQAHLPDKKRNWTWNGDYFLSIRFYLFLGSSKEPSNWALIIYKPQRVISNNVAFWQV